GAPRRPRGGRSGPVVEQQFLGHYDRVLAPAMRGVIARASADLVEAFVLVARDRGRVGRAHLHEHASRARPPRHALERAQRPPATRSSPRSNRRPWPWPWWPGWMHTLSRCASPAPTLSTP